MMFAISTEWHSGQGSHFPEIILETGSRLKICLLCDGLLAQNSEAILDVIVKLAGEAVFKILAGCIMTHSKTHINSHNTLLV